MTETNKPEPLDLEALKKERVMIKFEVTNRWSGEVQFTAEIDCDENKSRYFKLGLAVKWALKNKVNLGGADLGGANLRGAYLGGAYLRGAYLRGADLGGLKIVQGPVREDGYQYILYTSALGGCVIKAGCRTWIGENAIERAYEHCADVTDEKYSPQATRIIDYLAGELRAIRELDAFSATPPKL